jgi:hypothetical protein
MQSWNVYLNGKWIDTVFFSESHSANDVKFSLVEHDGYPDNIQVEEFE